MQRVIERLDALDEEYSASGRSAIKGKVAGIVITGSEDGALSVMGGIMMVLSWMGLRKNMATMHMAKNLAQNLVYHARLLKAHPQTPLPGKAVCCEAHAGVPAT